MAFNVLAAPAGMYQNIIDHLGVYGASLKDMKLDAAVLADANITCQLLNYSAMLRIRLDGWGLSLFKLNETGKELAARILNNSWACVHQTDPKLEIIHHDWAVSIWADIRDNSYKEVIGQYLNPVKRLPENSSAAIAFYLPEVASVGEGRGNLNIEPFEAFENRLHLRISGRFDATKVPIDTLKERIQEYIRKNLEQLDLKILES